MATIKEKANVYAKDYLFNPLPQRAPNIHFEAGANAVLEMIETYIHNLDLGNSAEEKFYKLDVISDIGLYIKELKGE